MALEHVPSDLNLPPIYPYPPRLNAPFLPLLCACVAYSTKGLPISFIPEQVIVTLMGVYMIHDGCRFNPASIFTEPTQWMLIKE